MKSRARQTLDKSIAATLAAIEVYNKPTFSYREESFAILAINAWELLFKARILQLSKNRMASILEYERRKKLGGSLSEKKYWKKNRSGNHSSVGIFKAHDLLVNDHGDSIPGVVRKNLEAIGEVRDNAVHFLNKDLGLRKKIHELGTANLKNYLNLIRQWFGTDLGEFNLFLMPIAFLGGVTSAECVVMNAEERNLLDYVKGLEKGVDDDVTRDFNLSLDIDIRLRRVSESGATKVTISDSPDAVPVRISEEDVRDQFPWDYRVLTTNLRKRYSDFMENREYHRLRKVFEENPKLCNTRYLDPGNAKSTKKNFYSPNILAEFDKHYSRSTSLSSRRENRMVDL